MASTIEAFFAAEGGGALGPTFYRAGYRCSETGNPVCVLELPVSVVETTVLGDAKLAAAVGSDGYIRLSLYGAYRLEVAEAVPSVTEPIDRLIAQIVSLDNLHLEEITSADLNALLQRLFRSVALVQEAMKHLSDQHTQNPT